MNSPGGETRGIPVRQNDIFLPYSLSATLFFISVSRNKKRLLVFFGSFLDKFHILVLHNFFINCAYSSCLTRRNFLVSIKASWSGSVRQVPLLYSFRNLLGSSSGISAPAAVPESRSPILLSCTCSEIGPSVILTVGAYVLIPIRSVDSKGLKKARRHASRLQSFSYPSSLSWIVWILLLSDEAIFLCTRALSYHILSS